MPFVNYLSRNFNIMTLRIFKNNYFPKVSFPSYSYPPNEVLYHDTSKLTPSNLVTLYQVLYNSLTVYSFFSIGTL